MKNNYFLSRRKKIQKNLDEHQAILISNPSDIFYLTNFQFLVPQEREALLVVCKKKSYLLYPSFSPIPHDNDLSFLISPHYLNLTKNLNKIILENNITSLQFDPHSLFQIEFQQLKKLKIKLEKQSINLVENERLIKDDHELMHIKKSCLIAKKTIKRIQKNIRAGITEIELKNLLEQQLRDFVSPHTSFPTIVAFGKNTALPHHQPTHKKLKKEMPILIDFGAKVNGYCSDMTRTFWYGEDPEPEFIKIEKSVKTAYRKVINQLKTNQKTQAKTLDETARKSIENDGLGQYFIHTTGHGLGLDIHEPPSLNWHNQQLISTGMIITVEPGIYLEGKFGYRHENTILITKNKIEELTK